MIQDSGDEYGVIEIDSCTQKADIEKQLFDSDAPDFYLIFNKV